MPSTSETIDFKAPLRFLEEYAGHEYRNPGTPGYSAQQTADFADILAKGRNSVEQFKKMVSACGTATGLVLNGQIRWDDASHVKVRSYIWAELVLPEAKGGPESISIFANVNDGVARYRFALETRNDKAKKIPGALEAHHRFLDVDIPNSSKLVYVSGSDEHGAPNVITESRETIKRKVLDGSYEKVQLCRVIEDSDAVANEDYFEAMIEAVKELLPFYRKAISDYAGNGASNTIPSTNQAPLTFPKNMIFYGAPGTGKTYHTVNQAIAICEKKSLEQISEEYSDRSEVTKRYRELLGDGHISFVTFHQSYTYEDFVIGIFPDFQSGSLNYVTRSGAFKRLCDLAAEDPDHNYVMVIDEINRGNISKIFGELITLIEDTKRIGQAEETRAILPYPDELGRLQFGVPSNVYIIGTMNTADRSIQHVDTALRRRFVFAEMEPDSSLLGGVSIAKDGKTLNLGALLSGINKRIKRYYDREHVIGHAYFMDMVLTEQSDEEKLVTLGSIFYNRIIPLLQDYFFEDYSKIQKVLGEEEETETAKSLVRKLSSSPSEDEDGGHDVYEIAPANDEAYTNIETYLLMVEK